MSPLNQMKWRIQAGVEVSDCKGPTVWRRHKPLRAAQTAAGRGWRWPTRCSLHPAWSQRLPLRLEHNTTSETIQSDGGERDGRAQQGRWLSEGGKHKWVLLTITSTETLGWTNAHSDSGRQMFTDRHGTHKKVTSSLSFGLWKETSWAVDFWSLAEHIVRHTWAELTFQRMVAIAVMGGCKKSLCQSGHNRFKWAVACCLSCTHHLAKTSFNWRLRAIIICCGYRLSTHWQRCE